MNSVTIRLFGSECWKDDENVERCFQEGVELVLSTCSPSCEPNADIVISLGFVDGRLLIADSQMNTRPEKPQVNEEGARRGQDQDPVLQDERPCRGLQIRKVYGLLQ